jgi:hypothetical protein
MVIAFEQVQGYFNFNISLFLPMQKQPNQDKQYWQCGLILTNDEMT